MRKSGTTYLPVDQYSTGNKTTNYNFEEHPEFAKKQEAARKQRDILSEIEKKVIIPRRKRRIYDRPKYDLDISK